MGDNIIASGWIEDSSGASGVTQLFSSAPPPHDPGYRTWYTCPRALNKSGCCVWTTVENAALRIHERRFGLARPENQERDELCLSSL